MQTQQATATPLFPNQLRPHRHLGLLVNALGAAGAAPRPMAMGPLQAFRPSPRKSERSPWFHRATVATLFSFKIMAKVGPIVHSSSGADDPVNPACFFSGLHSTV